MQLQGQGDALASSVSDLVELERNGDRIKAHVKRTEVEDGHYRKPARLADKGWVSSVDAEPLARPVVPLKP
jgi:hypothetical protein